MFDLWQPSKLFPRNTFGTFHPQDSTRFSHSIWSFHLCLNAINSKKVFDSDLHLRLFKRKITTAIANLAAGYSILSLSYWAVLRKLRKTVFTQNRLFRSAFSFHFEVINFRCLWRYVHTFRLGTWTPESGPWTLQGPESPVVHVASCVHVSTFPHCPRCLLLPCVTYKATRNKIAGQRIRV